MSNPPIHPNWERVPPVRSLIFILLIAIVGFYMIGPMLGILLTFPFYPGSLMEMITDLSYPIAHPDIKMTMILIQGITTFAGFIVAPFIYGKYYLGLTSKDMFGNEFPTPGLGLLVVALVIVFMGANSIFIEWNASVQLPEFLSGFERWARNLEDQLQEVTKFITNFNNTPEFLLALLVIAVLPAIGEELVFRGFIQTHLRSITQNAHLAIWLSACIFSFFHFQFFGFIPRLFLGALFGYLYLWSGNIIYPIVAHFVNNGFTLLMIYFFHLGTIDFDIEATESVPISNVLISMVVSAVLLYLFYSNFRKKSTDEQLEDRI